MQEIKETNPAPLPKQEICSIRIMFPVVSDEQALEKKKQVAALLADIPDVVIQFSLTASPKSMPLG